MVTSRLFHFKDSEAAIRRIDETQFTCPNSRAGYSGYDHTIKETIRAPRTEGAIPR
jgi:hypothetical protein